jgi:hypothetical protein
MEHRQVGAWTLAAVQDPSARTGIASAPVQEFGAAEFGGEVGWGLGVRHHICAFGSDAAHPYAPIAAERRHAGRPISHFDAQIAAIAHSAGAAVASRNVADFDGCGLEVIKPWEV